MANQPPTARPWFRLPTVGRQAPPPAPPPAPTPPAPTAPQPRPPFIRPAFSQAFRPTFTQPQPAPPPQPPPPPPPPPTAPSQPTPPSPPLQIVSRSPPPPPSPHAISSPKPTLISSPPTVRPSEITPPQSPARTTRSPPSPFTLPPQLKPSKGETEPRMSTDAEPKRILVQETFKEPVAFTGASKDDQVKGLGHSYNKKLSSDSEDGGSVRIITITGENRGAVMEIKDHKGNATSSHLPMSAHMNSNVQSVNSSILYNCSCTHHDPGLHWSLSRKPVDGHGKGHGHGIKHRDHANGKQL